LKTPGKLGLVEAGTRREQPADYLVGKLKAKRLGERPAVFANTLSDRYAFGRISQRGDQ
jgi:hypothetical protein